MSDWPDRWPDGGRIEPPQTPVEVEITAEEFGADWPFTVERGILRCYAMPAASIGAVTFEAEGVEYALNGPALRFAEHRGWTEIRDESIWADAEGPLPKKYLGHVVARGQSLIA